MDAVLLTAIEDAVTTIRNADVRQLSSPAWLEHEFLPQLGLSDVLPAFYPASLRPFCGTGLRSFQQPNQFARYLSHLSRCKVTSYLEIGVWQGGTFIITVEYLTRFNEIERAMAVDVSIREPIQHYARMNSRVSLLEGDSKAAAMRMAVRQQWWDLAMIDGDHSEEGCFFRLPARPGCGWDDRPARRL